MNHDELFGALGGDSLARRTANCLLREYDGWMPEITAQSLSTLSRDDLLDIRTFGIGCLARVEAWLAREGLALKPSRHKAPAFALREKTKGERMKIEHITDSDGEPRRRMFLLVEVSFRDRPREARGEEDNYYDDDELPGVVATWMRSATYDRDDSPRVKFMALPEVLDADIQSVARGDYPGHVEERF